MFADLYVREKLRELSQNASRPARMPAGAADVPFAMPVMRSLGRVLCRMGERLQQAGASSDGSSHTGLREHNLRLRRTG